MAAKKIPNRQKTPPRKPKQEWRLSKNAKIGLIVGAAALVLIAIIWILVYNMQALKLDAEGHVVVPEGHNYLVYNEKTPSNPRYLKLGEVGPAEGYTLDKTDFLTDPNEMIYCFVPASDAEPRLDYRVMVGKRDYMNIAESTITSVSAMLKDATASELKTAKIGGRDVAYYLYSGGSLSSQDTEKIDHYAKQMNAYVAAPGGKCVVMLLEQRSDDNGSFADDAAFEALLEKAVAGLKL